MQDWFQLCNLRSSLLHLQFIYCDLQERINDQKRKIQRAHKDRLIQYHTLWQEYINLEKVNFKRLVIIKLQSCIATYDKDHDLWQLMDRFISYSKAMEDDLMDNISKLYLGKKVMFDISLVQKELRGIQQRIISFLSTHTGSIDTYQRGLKEILETRNLFGNYISNIKNLYNEISIIYQNYIRKKLKERTCEIDFSIQKLKQEILK